MKRKLAAILSMCIISVASSCGGVNVENEVTIGDLDLVQISDIHYYDKETKIVFLWNGSHLRNDATMPVPYPASNGLPYRYDEETNEMEEINPKIDLETGEIIYE